MAHENIIERRAHVKRIIDSGHSINKELKRFLANLYGCHTAAIFNDALICNLPELRRSIYLTPTRRRKILERDQYTCQYCLSVGGDLIIEHVIPARYGGHGRPYNLVAACHSCNVRKRKQVWVPRNLDAITEDQPAWREMVLMLANGKMNIIDFMKSDCANMPPGIR